VTCPRYPDVGPPHIVFNEPIHSSPALLTLLWLSYSTTFSLRIPLHRIPSIRTDIYIGFASFVESPASLASRKVYRSFIGVIHSYPRNHAGSLAPLTHGLLALRTRDAEHSSDLWHLRVHCKFLYLIFLVFATLFSHTVLVLYLTIVCDIRMHLLSCLDTAIFNLVYEK
jgi:hypothetical protein